MEYLLIYVGLPFGVITLWFILRKLGIVKE